MRANWQVTEISYFQILGRSNLNTFYLEYAPAKCADSCLIKQINGAVTLFVPVACIKGENKLLERDMYDLLQVNQHPYIVINPHLDSTVDPNRPTLLKFCITIKGVQNCYYLSLLELSESNNKNNLKGQIKLNLTDFDIRPPEKFMGLVKVRNEVIISFELEIQPKPLN